MNELLLVTLASIGVLTLAAAVQAITGFGLALVAVPLLAMVVDPVSAVVGVTIIALLLTATVACAERDHIDIPNARLLSITGILGIPLGLLVLTTLKADHLTLLMAAILLTLVAMMALKIRPPSGLAARCIAGITSGALLSSTGMNGPPLVVILQSMNMPARPFRATLQAIFCIQNIFAIIAFIAAGTVNTTVAAILLGGIAGFPLGWRIGNKLFHMLSPTRFRQIVFLALTATAVVAAIKALT